MGHSGTAASAREGGWTTTRGRDAALLNEIFYVLPSGYVWSMLSRQYPPRSTVYGYFARFRDEGIWERIMTTLRERSRVQAGH